MSRARPTLPDISGLTLHAAVVADGFLAERDKERRHLVIALTGAHAYGFPSVDSDLDLKGVHVAPTRSLLGLRAAAPAAHQMEVREGVELDYASNEIGQVLAGLLGGSGSYLERIAGPWKMTESADLPALAELARKTLSRRYHRHYAGFSRGQRRELDSAEAPTAKKLLYVLRTALTGAHLLLHGEVVTDLGRLAARHGWDGVGELIAHKRTAERVPLDAPALARWTPEMDRAQAYLDAAVARSPLPEEPPDEAAAACDAWLIELRLGELGRAG